MKMKRRSRFEIVADILDMAKEGTKKTRLVYETNLNFSMLGKYLKILSEKGLVFSEDGEILATVRGLELLEKYEELMMIWNMTDVEEPIRGYNNKFSTVSNGKSSKILSSRAQTPIY